MRRNILIFHSGALGDFILTWPLAMALGRIFAQSRIIYVTAASKGELARQVLGLEAIDAEAGWHGLFAEDTKPPFDHAHGNQAAVAKWLEGANLIISFVAGPNDLWFENIRKLAPEAKIICVHPRPEGDYAGHVTQYFIDQLGELPVLQQGVGQIVGSLAQRPIKIQNLKPERVVIHPGAGAVRKCWPAERYLQLIERFRQAGRSVRMLMGEVERERWGAEQIAKFEAASEMVWPKNYYELFKQLRQAEIFIGNDSGPAHLAGIIGVPTMAVFQASDPVQWRPLGPKVRIGLGEVGVDEVIREMEGIVDLGRGEAR